MDVKFSAKKAAHPYRRMNRPKGEARKQCFSFELDLRNPVAVVNKKKRAARCELPLDQEYNYVEMGVTSPL